MNAKSWKQPSPAGEGAQETPSLLTYLTTNDPAQRDAAFLQTYAARLRDGTAQSWEIPNTVASTIEDIAQRLVNHTLPPERAALVEQLKALADDDDKEQRHMDADAALLNYINDSEISAAFHAIKKWYA